MRHTCLPYKTITEKESVFSTEENPSASSEKMKLKFDHEIELSNAFEYFCLNHASNSSPASTKLSEPIIEGNSKELLRTQLISTGLNPILVDDVLSKYKGETNIDKLDFLARGMLFSSEF